jgi:NAD+ synthase (glutamine-hydrolysing)
VSICEDLWSPDGPPEAQSAAGAQILLVPNASPFHRGKAAGRLANTTAVATRNGLPVVYVNFVGGQDELAFDGGSLIVDGQGRLLHRGLEFTEDRFCVDVPVAGPRPVSGPVTNVHTRPVLRPDIVETGTPREPLPDVEAVWQAIVATLRDYMHRNGFEGVALGLSGGIDSAVTAALAVDAVGPDRVIALAMPSPETAARETVDGRSLADNLGIELRVVHLVSPSSAAVVVDPEGEEPGETRTDRERRYARARTAILGDLVEDRRYLVLATGNKSEISIGDASLFGDLSGGFAPLKDCPKTLVYELARLRNKRGEVFPGRVLDQPSVMRRFPTLGVASYEVLDDIVQRDVEYGQGLTDMLEAGHDAETIQTVLRRIDDAELVRRYAPPGPKVTSRAFSQDRRMPISNEWRAHHRR